jgi:hypothetical protein
LNVPVSAVRIVAGEPSRAKRFLSRGLLECGSSSDSAFDGFLWS